MARGRMAGTAITSVLVAIPKKGDLTDCANYRIIALITHFSNIILLIILKD